MSEKLNEVGGRSITTKATKKGDTRPGWCMLRMDRSGAAESRDSRRILSRHAANEGILGENGGKAKVTTLTKKHKFR